MKIFTLLLISALLSISNSYADRISDLANAKCIKCHNSDPDEVSKIHFPALGGLSQEYLFQALKAYQNGARHNQYSAVYLMSKRVKFDDATLKGLAEFYSQMPARAGVPGDAVIVAKGKEIYDHGIKSKGVMSCLSCHGLKGEGDEENPRLAGQYSWYLANQMYYYKHGKIHNQKEMIEIATKLSDDEVAAVSTYLQSI